MATISISIPDAVMTDVRDVLAADWGYSATVTDQNGNSIPNPVTPGAFVKAKVAEFIKNSYIAAKARVAAKAAADSTVSSTSSVDIS